MTPNALRAAIASARLRPRMYGSDPRDLATYLLGLVAGASPDGAEPRAAWAEAMVAARPAGACDADDVPLTNAEVCDVALRVVAALWPQGDAPAGDECAAFSDVPLDTPMPPAFVDALAALSPAPFDLPDGDECFRTGDDAGRLRNLLAVIHRDGGHYTEAVGIAQACCDAAARVLAAYHAGDAPARRAAEAGALTTADVLRLADSIGHGELDAEAVGLLVARVRELEAQLAAAQPAVALDALRNGRFTAHCCACSAEWPLGVRDCPGCGHPDRDAGAVPDRDLCPHCGALDLDHVCPKSAATVAGEAFAAEHPEAAGRILG